MEENNTTTVTTTPVVEEVKVETPVVETKDGGNEEVSLTKKEDAKVDYVKIRVERAKEQTTKNILKELGVENLEDAKKALADGSKALEEVSKLKAKLEAQDHESEVAKKKSLLTKVLNDEKVFDADALINYVDLDKVEIDETGAIKDKDGIINSLKSAKPNFFGKFETVSDNYVKGQTTKPLTALDKQNNGDKIGAIQDYLKTIMK